MARIDVEFRMLEHGADLGPPQVQSQHAAGFDLAAAVPENTPITLAPGARALIPCGFQMAFPAGFEAQVRPRSGLALNHGVTVLNAPGTIDADYRGEVAVILINHGETPFVVSRGQRIAQLVFQALPSVDFCETNELPPSGREARGFGSTGL